LSIIKLFYRAIQDTIVSLLDKDLESFRIVG